VFDCDAALLGCNIVQTRTIRVWIERGVGDAAMSWSDVDLTALADAPPASGGGMGYVTNLPGQGPVARVLYWNEDDNHAHELSTADGKHWSHADLTDLAHAPEVALRPMGYVTSLAGQGPVVRVIYLASDPFSQREEGVHELSTSEGRQWSHADLTDLADAPLAAGGSTGGPPQGYTTSLAGQSAMARVVYLGGHDRRIHELSTPDGGHWSHADLTDLADGPPADGWPMAYTTSLAGQSPVARVLYRATDNHIHEFSTSS
jgi:hypothetical protein